MKTIEECLSVLDRISRETVIDVVRIERAQQEFERSLDTLTEKHTRKSEEVNDLLRELNTLIKL
jgi:hypothetical protein